MRGHSEADTLTQRLGDFCVTSWAFPSPSNHRRFRTSVSTVLTLKPPLFELVQKIESLQGAAPKASRMLDASVCSDKCTDRVTSYTNMADGQGKLPSCLPPYLPVSLPR